ncbi:TorD/DmsD family molecular chaperone [Desulfosoma sp.]|uniref:TorD/DmsD family molecular chaperone n=2 Tax=Desulfosoma sp. TaxID=2603217 RepID=UPI0040494ECB
MRHDGAHHQGLKPLDRSRAAVLSPMLAWAKTAARYPQTPEHLETLLESSEPLVHNLGSAQPFLEELLSRWMEGPHTVLEAHQVEYTRLFVARWGGVPAPLYASWYLDRESYAGNAMEAALSFFQRWGVMWQETALKEPPDHLAVELEFLEILCAAAQSGPEKRGEYAEAASVLWNDFRRTHFDLWVPRCVQAMERHATMPVYKILALILRQLCEGE